jgi:hypothetical protein
VLQAVYGEALGLRDATKGTLVRQELSAVNMTKIREKEVQDLRYRERERLQSFMAITSKTTHRKKV